MDETKKVLRNLLLSSPMVSTVMNLNEDYKNVMGCDIPYAFLGYENLLDFLNAIPDVLTVNGNSFNSQVKLRATVEIARIIEKINYNCYLNRRKKLNEQCGSMQQMDLVTSATSTKYCKEAVQTKENDNIAKPINQKYLSHLGSSKTDSERNSSSNITLLPEEKPRALETKYNVLLPEKRNPEKQPQTNEILEQEDTILRRLNFNDDSHRAGVLSDNDIDLRKCRKLTNNVEDILSSLNVKIAVDELNTSDTSDSMRQLLLQKYSSKDISQENSRDINDDILTCINQSEIERTESENYDCDSKVPRRVQDNLMKLIQGIPESIWCSQLPDEYKKKFGKELRFEKFGYRSLIHMCMDLKSILHCNKESICDFKLYDITRPMPQVEIIPDDQAYSGNVLSFKEDEPPSLPALDWENCAQLFPKDVVGPGFIISRDFVSESEIESDIFRVVVAEIYDPSKFWLFRDDGQLDALMDEMQPFYKTNNERYRIPEQFLEAGLYCVAMWQKVFHRCVIVKMQTDATFVHIFYIDYGSLGTVPKNELWFLTEDFVRLPGQAIRARLADIYPPIQFSMWTSEASDRFRQLADMKHLEARIVRVSREKKVIEVSVEDPIDAPGRDINSILVDEEHALYENQYRKMNIHDSNCTTRVNFIHLLPDFEEIENWLAPSIEEMSRFSNTALTPDFYIPHYFSRSIDKNLHNNIEIEAMKLMKKKKQPIKYVDIKYLERIENMKDIMKVSYGDLYEKYKEKLSETMEYCIQYCESINKSSENPNKENEWDLTDMDCVNSQLRRKSSDQNVPQCTTCYGITNGGSPFSTAKDEMDEYFEGSNREEISPRRNNSMTDKLLDQLDTWIDLSQLENFLSHQGPSTSSATNGNFINTDESNPDTKSEKNKSSDINAERSLSKG